MKRRNADCGKIRRPIKRNKITEGMYGSTTILYMKFLILWAIVITADFMFMFRFEFLWPFWLLLRSVHDSFKYKGLAFSVLFVCIAITSDLVCLFFIPVHWLLFAASTYVWVQYVWHTDKGICLPTIILWMLFVYLEAGIRWKDSRHMPHLDLCRPFAAHCIGYPVVTLGFGFKSYVGYRMRQRKQREVAKENEFYMQLLQQALPQEENTATAEEVKANGSCQVQTSAAQNNVVAVESAGQPQTSNALLSSCSSSTTTSTTTATTTSADDKNYVQLVGTTTAAFQQQPPPSQATNASIHVNHNNMNNNHSSSSSRGAQTNKINYLSNASSNGTSTTTTAGAATTLTTSTTANGHISGKSRRSADRDREFGTTATNLRLSAKEQFAANKKDYQVNETNHSHRGADKENWEIGNFMSSSSSSTSSANSTATKEKNNYENSNGNCNTELHSSSASSKKSQSNGNVIQYEVEEVVEPVEKVKGGRRNRSKRDNNNTSSKDNHHNHHHHQQHHNNNHQNNNNNHSNSSTTSHHMNSNHLHNNNNTNAKDSNSDTSSVSSAASSTSNSTRALSNLASQVVTKICETCHKLEADVKKYRSEISHMKQIENELRQKLESNLTTKNCLQAKQKECDELDKKMHELANARQVDMMSLQNAERRLVEERRQRQSLEAQLNNEKKARKVAEEKASRQECSESCKQRKLQIENEAKQLRRELKVVEEAKQTAEQQGRKCEQELRMFEAEIRNRDAQPGTDMLMSALAVMQDKNSTLEKNLSAETRVKLDLFSALGEAKRQLEITDSMLRSKQEEVLDLKAKIAQLLAVMPTDTLCLPSCNTSGGSMLRMNDTPPLQGPSSPMMGMGAAAAAVAAHQQLLAGHQLNSRVPTSVVNASSCVTNVSTSSTMMGAGGGGGSVGNQCPPGSAQGGQSSSNLDPNASVYTPKNNSLVGGAEA